MVFYSLPIYSSRGSQFIGCMELLLEPEGFAGYTKKTGWPPQDHTEHYNKGSNKCQRRPDGSPDGYYLTHNQGRNQCPLDAPQSTKDYGNKREQEHVKPHVWSGHG